MAPLNPTVNPTQDPNYRGYSDPIKVPDTIKEQGVTQNQIMPKGQEIGDRSAEYLGKAEAYGMAAEGAKMEAYGDLFKNLTQMGDFIGKGSVAVTKKSIEDQVYKIATDEREEYTQTLEKIKQSGVSNILAPSDERSDSGSGEAPEEIQNLGDSLAALKSAKDAGKIPQSYFYGRINEKAKMLRSQYPGFKDVIDSEFAKVLGTNPANAYMRSLVTEINRNASSASKDQNKAVNFVLQRNGYPGAKEAMDNIRTGKWGLPEAMQWSAPYEREDFELKSEVARINNAKLKREEQAVAVGTLFDKAAGISVNRMVTAQSLRMGIANAEDASKLSTAAEAGIIPQQQWIQWGQELASQKASVVVKMTQDADRSGATAILGKKAVNERIADAVKPIDALIERIYQKDIGGYTRFAQDMQAITDNAKKALLTHPKLGPPLAVSSALKEIGGEQNLQRFSADLIKGDYPGDLKTFASQYSKNMATQYMRDRNGGTLTFNDVIDDIRTKSATNPEMNNAAFNRAVLKEVTKITDPTIPEAIRLNYAEAAFSQGNRGMISKLSKDGFDSKGRPTTGQSAVFNDFTSPAMTAAMFELGKKNPQVWKNYVSWAESTLASELVNTEINSLAEIRNPAIRVSWDSDNKRFNAVADVGAAMRSRASGSGMSLYNPQQDPEFLNVQRTTNRLNSYLSNYSNIAKAANVDPDAFILRTIANANPEALRNVNSIPYQILRDIGIAKQKGIGSK